uniref:hypothetical protein n=1 Tax=Mycolicibacterium obuense TaxID=1807 RepID=UPI003F58B0EC
MSVEFPSREGAADRATARALDLAAAALALAQVTNEAFNESTAGASERQISSIETASEQIIVAVDGLPGVQRGQRRIAAAISRELSTLAADLRGDTRAELNPT